jgi:hypothetical protein
MEIPRLLRKPLPSMSLLLLAALLTGGGAFAGAEHGGATGGGANGGPAGPSSPTGVSPAPGLLPEIRRAFSRAVRDEAVTEETFVWIEQSFAAPRESWPPVVLAYYASLEGLKGKHSRDIFAKLTHVQRAIGLIRDLPDAHPDSLEILFLRFSFFHQLPLFFGVRSYVAPDLARLIGMLEERRFEEVPVQVQRDMVDYILGCGEAGSRQRARLARLRGELAVQGDR